MVPMWMFPFAIACGNSFILKPSEKVPMTPARTCELLHDAGIPEGVYNLIHGDKVAVDALLEHPLVRAISFVGSSPVAKYVYETAAKYGKRVQALGGAKNHLVVTLGANLEKSVEAIISSSFGAAGERCLAGSVLVPVGDVAEPLLDLLLATTKKMKVGDGLEAGTEMGPVVTDEHRKKIVGYIEKGVAEGAKPLCDGREAANCEGYFVGPTIFDHVTPEMTIAKEEIFGPVLSVIRVKTLDEAIELVNSSKFGNTTSIFTSDGKSAREYASRIECGMVGVNIGVAAPMAFFPFSGWKNSFFGDLHAHGKDAVGFYTEQKVIMTRHRRSFGARDGRAKSLQQSRVRYSTRGAERGTIVPDRGRRARSWFRKPAHCGHVEMTTWSARTIRLARRVGRWGWIRLARHKGAGRGE
jgi:malonate-semialdehyde dehydrogenase (acetylating)/methylmalonate-semialdehyde dehydrogenase